MNDFKKYLKINIKKDVFKKIYLVTHSNECIIDNSRLLADEYVNKIIVSSNEEINCLI